MDENLAWLLLRIARKSDNISLFIIETYLHLREKLPKHQQWECDLIYYNQTFQRGYGNV